MSSTTMLFTPAALKILRRTSLDGMATRRYDIMSGGFYWSDEFPDEFRRLIQELHPENHVFQNLNAFRCVVGYRTSLITGHPRSELAGTWQQLQQECPNWPGFAAERRSTVLRESLRIHDSQWTREFTDYGQKMEEAARIRSFLQSKPDSDT